MSKVLLGLVTTGFILVLASCSRAATPMSGTPIAAVTPVSTPSSPSPTAALLPTATSVSILEATATPLPVAAQELDVLPVYAVDPYWGAPSQVFRDNLWLVRSTQVEQRPLVANWIGEYFASTGKVLFGRSAEGDTWADCVELWALDLRASQETPLLQDPCVEMASLSPDGRWLAYISNQRLWLRDLHESTVHQIDTAYHRDLAWAPESDALAYTDIDGRRILEVPSLSIRQVYTYHPPPALRYHPGWSSDGRWMVLGATPGGVGITLVSRDTYQHWALTCAPSISEQCSELPYPTERFWFDSSSRLLIFDGADPDWYGTGVWVLELDDSLHTVTNVWSLIGYQVIGWNEPGHSIIVPGFPGSGSGVVQIIDVRSGERLRTIEVSES